MYYCIEGPPYQGRAAEHFVGYACRCSRRGATPIIIDETLLSFRGSLSKYILAAELHVIQVMWEGCKKFYECGNVSKYHDPSAECSPCDRTGTHATGQRVPVTFLCCEHFHGR